MLLAQRSKPFLPLKQLRPSRLAKADLSWQTKAIYIHWLRLRWSRLAAPGLLPLFLSTLASPADSNSDAAITQLDGSLADLDAGYQPNDQPAVARARCDRRQKRLQAVSAAF